MTATDPTGLRPSLPRKRAGRRGDLVFRWVAQLSGVLVLVLIVAIAAFLVDRAVPAFRRTGLRFFSERAWSPDADHPRFGIEALAFGTVASSICALVMAVPVALGSALFLTEVAPPRVGRWTGYLIDLLAAVPSVVYGLWGVFYLVPRLKPVERWLDGRLGFIPLLHSRGSAYGRSLFDASVVLAIMILPIIAAIAREVFRQVPAEDREAAMALGATRWETIRLSVLPYSRGGIVGAMMLGLGRALGETIAVALVLLSVFKVDLHILEPGGNTVAANIATKFGDAGARGREALIASGLVLFAITLVVNVIARGVVYRTGLAAEGRP